jgi:adenosylhomocysteine nucleosidase
MKKINTLLLTPLVKERDNLLGSLTSAGYNLEKLVVGKLQLFYFEALNLYVAAGGHGKCQFALQAQYLIDRLDKIDLLICAGAAGSISKTVTAGDIVVATSTVEHDYNLKFIKRKLPEFKGASRHIKKIEQVEAEFKNFKVHFARIASGDEDIIDSARAEEIRKNTGAVAVAWEGAGGARASCFNQIDFLEIRGITDFADKSARIDFETNLQNVMHRIGKLIAFQIDQQYLL